MNGEIVALSCGCIANSRISANKKLTVPVEPTSVHYLVTRSQPLAVN
jgi:hypothetical protein